MPTSTRSDPGCLQQCFPQERTWILEPQGCNTFKIIVVCCERLTKPPPLQVVCAHCSLAYSTLASSHAAHFAGRIRYLDKGVLLPNGKKSAQVSKRRSIKRTAYSPELLRHRERYVRSTWHIPRKVSSKVSF
jgi:hypothetical protein